MSGANFGDPTVKKFASFLTNKIVSRIAFDKKLNLTKHIFRPQTSFDKHFSFDQNFDFLTKFAFLTNIFDQHFNS